MSAESMVNHQVQVRSHECVVYFILDIVICHTLYEWSVITGTNQSRRKRYLFSAPMVLKFWMGVDEMQENVYYHENLRPESVLV